LGLGFPAIIQPCPIIHYGRLNSTFLTLQPIDIMKLIGYFGRNEVAGSRLISGAEHSKKIGLSGRLFLLDADFLVNRAPFFP
jgi:hypothetical protein